MLRITGSGVHLHSISLQEQMSPGPGHQCAATNPLICYLSVLLLSAPPCVNSLGGNSTSQDGSKFVIGNSANRGSGTSRLLITIGIYLLILPPKLYKYLQESAVDGNY